MSGPTDESAEKSRKIKDQALKILRETRAKMDPRFLSAMKERFSAMAPGVDADMPLSSRQTAKPIPKQAGPKASAAGAAAMYSQTAKVADNPPSNIMDDDKMEAVDRQKVAQIVMEYMKLRESSKTQH